MVGFTVLYFNLLAVALIVLGCVLLIPAQTNEENLVSIDASVAPDKLSAGAETQLSIKLNLAEGAHANSNEVADPNLIATVFLPKPKAGLSWGQVNYPEPSKVNEWYSTDPLSVFKDGATIRVPLTIDKTAARQLTLEGTLRIQICDSEKCYPMRKLLVTASLTVVNANAADPAPVQKTVVKSSIVSSSANGQPASAANVDFPFTDFTGKSRKLSEFRGKFVLLDYWATWCKPCLADIPKIKELYEKHKAGGFEIVGMDSETLGDDDGDADPEFAKETAERAKQIVATRGVTWTQATAATAVPVAKKVFGVKALPTKILIDKEGKEIARIGEKDDLTGMVERLLDEKK